MKRNTAKLKEDLLQAGITEIEKHGLDQLSLRTIAKTCGVTHGTPYRHFENKEGFLRAVLARISTFCAQCQSQGISQDMPAQKQLSQMGYNFVNFAKAYPYFFEALFIKYPFKYMKVTQDTIVSDTDLPGFTAFKTIVRQLREEKHFSSTEAENLFHFWSFITGLAILAQSPIGQDLNDRKIQTTIDNMVTIYSKGEKS